jgi:hypothetical protein
MNVRPDRNPTLDRDDLELILLLIEGGIRPQTESPAAQKLKKKVENSLSVYHWEDGLLEEARRKFEEQERKEREEDEILDGLLAEARRKFKEQTRKEE